MASVKLRTSAGPALMDTPVWSLCKGIVIINDTKNLLAAILAPKNPS